MNSNRKTLTVVGVALDGKVAVEVEAVDVPEVTWGAPLNYSLYLQERTCADKQSELIE